MAAFVVGLLLLLAMVDHSDAAYCVCNSGLSDSVLQKNIDYACGAGADCAQILQNGACYNPNTVKDHCNFAVNSYYQRRQATGATCDFQGTCTLTQTPPNAASGCAYPSSASNGGSTTPTTGGNSTTGTNLPGGSLSPPAFALAPGSSFGNTDNSNGGMRLLCDQWSRHIVFIALVFSLTVIARRGLGM